MATESKPIDLGALQSMQKHAEAMVTTARRILDGAYTKYDNAAQALENAKVRHKDAQEFLAKAKRAVIEGARTVANGG